MAILGGENIIEMKHGIIREMGNASVAICGAENASLVKFKPNVFTQADDAI